MKQSERIGRPTSAHLSQERARQPPVADAGTQRQVVLEGRHLAAAGLGFRV